MSDSTETPGGTPIEHDDHGLLWEHLDRIDTILEEQSDGFFIGAYDLTDDCPDLMSALHGPDAGDKPIPENEVFYEKRNGRPGPSRLIDRPCRPCRRMVVCGIKGEASVILTAYGTQASKETPRAWWDASMTPLEAIEAARFWSKHALSSQG